MREMWALDPEVSYLNHGSFGACPRPVLEVQTRLRAELEAQPMAFFGDLERRADAARARLAEFVGADAGDLAFVTNATAAVNGVARSLELEPGDELLVTNHGYNACTNALEYVAERAGGRVVTAKLPFPVPGPDSIVEAILSAVTERTRFALIDHVTSPSALVLPVLEISAALAARGIEVMIDGAHAPGMLPIDLRALANAGAGYYAGNLHKWVCAPKGAGFLFVRGDRQSQVRPPVISHGANAWRSDRSRFLLEHDWTGTHDPTPYLAVPAALDFLAGLEPGGWPALMAANRAGVLSARDTLLEALELEQPVPDQMIGAMASLVLPARPGESGCSIYVDPMQHELLTERRIQTMIVWLTSDIRVLRLSYQRYNRPEEFRALAGALAEKLRA